MTGDTPTMMSAEVGDLLGAVAKAQASIDNVAQDREVEVPIKDKVTGAPKGKYKFRYATLAGILNHLREPLTSNGLWFTQRIDEGRMVTRIVHSSGQWMDTGHIPVPNIKGNPQDIGSINSYFRRYSLGSAWGLASEEDNDGEMGEREVQFRARGERRDRDEVHDVATGVEEPVGGWGDWARTLIADAEAARSEGTLDLLKTENTRFINGVRKIDQRMYDDIQKTFLTKRQALKPSESF